MVDGGVTCYGTTGLEITLMGKPVILAGTAHYSGKGFTYDSVNKNDYLSKLEKAHQLGKLNKLQITNAYKYCQLMLFKNL